MYQAHDKRESLSGRKHYINSNPRMNTNQPQFQGTNLFGDLADYNRKSFVISDNNYSGNNPYGGREINKSANAFSDISAIQYQESALDERRGFATNSGRKDMHKPYIPQAGTAKLEDSFDLEFESRSNDVRASTGLGSKQIYHG